MNPVSIVDSISYNLFGVHMTPLNLWSIALFFISVIGLEIARRNIKKAWWYSIANQFLWFAYGWFTGQWGSMALAVTFVLLYLNNLRSHRRSDGKLYPRELDCGCATLVVFNTGRHRPTCSKSRHTAPAIEKKEAA